MWHGTQLDAGLVVHREAIHEVRASLVVADHLYIRAGASQARDDFVQRPHAGNVPKVRRRYVDDHGSPAFASKALVKRSTEEKKISHQTTQGNEPHTSPTALYTPRQEQTPS